MARWLGKKWSGAKGKGGRDVVVEGSDIREALSSLVEHKFQELDGDHDGNLSVKELEPAVADIGAALGLPAHGASPDSDQIYSEVLNEFTHGKQDKVSKSEFKEALSDILFTMAAAFKKDPIVILRIDGEDLKEFVNSPGFETEVVAILSQKEYSANASLRKCIISALEQLTVEHGMPPSSDSWVFSNLIEPALQSLSNDQLEQPFSRELFLEEFKKLVDVITQRLKGHPVIVAHSQNTFDGSCIERLLSNKFELNKLLDVVWRDLPKDSNQKASKEYLQLALDGMAASAGLPPYGAVHQVDAILDEVFRTVNADDGKIMQEEVFKKTMTEILRSIMLQLEGIPISVLSNSVVHEPMAASSTMFLSSASSMLPQSE